jgi:hypothetical protein
MYTASNHNGWKTNFKQYSRSFISVKTIFYAINSLIILYLFYNLSILQNFWNRGLTYKKSFKKLPSWSQDYKLMSWNSLTLFDEYLEMGLLIKNNNDLIDSK